MRAYDDDVLEFFLKNQSQLFDENVADTLDEADEFLDECMAQVVESIDEVRAYFEEMDLGDMPDDELEEASEVFKMPDGRYLLVEG